MTEDRTRKHVDYRTEEEKALYELMVFLRAKDRELLVKLLGTREGVELLRAKLTGRG